MDIPTYKRIAEALLQRHYLIGLNDTDLSDDAFVATAVKDNGQPFDYINEFAEDMDLDRMDETGFLRKGALTRADQERIMAELGIPLSVLEPKPMMLFRAKITWIHQAQLKAYPNIADDLARYLTWCEVSAESPKEAEELIRKEFASQVRGFTEVPDVIFDAIEITPAASRLTLLNGYGA